MGGVKCQCCVLASDNQTQENATLLTLWLYLDNKGALPSTGQTCPRHNQGTMVDKVNHQPKRIIHYPKDFFLWRCHTRRATTHDTV